VPAVERAEQGADDGEQQSEGETTKKQRAHRGDADLLWVGRRMAAIIVRRGGRGGN
jgi:hypothetical protein